MKLIRTFYRRITDDLKQKKLMPLKILFFVHASTILVLYPYLTIHMRELGINVEETAIMSAVTPIVFFIMPPIAGLLADKIGNFRLLLALSSSLGGAAALLLLAVPVGRLTITYPPAIELLAHCDGGQLGLQNIQDYPCHPTDRDHKHVNITILSCGFACDLPEKVTAEEINAITQMRFYDVHVRSNKDTNRIIYRHSISEPPVVAVMSTQDRSNSRVLTNDPFFDKVIKKVTERKLYFPAPNLYIFECDTNGTDATCHFGRDGSLPLAPLETIGVTETNFSYAFPADSKRMLLFNERSERGDTNSTRLPQNTFVDKGFWVKSISSDDSPEDNIDGEERVSCRDNFSDGSGRIRVRAGSRTLSRCTPGCASSAARHELCTNRQERVEVDPALTFWVYLAVRMFIGVISGTAFAMFEGAVIAVIREQRADYGLQRAYGSVGGMISSPLSGLLIDYASRGKDYTDFRPAFYLYAVLKIATGALMLSIDLEFKQPAQNLLQDVILVFRNVEMVALFIACFVMGTAWGYIESFLFWLLKDMDASSSLMGFTVTVGGVAGLPLLVFSGPIIQKLGHANVLFIGFVFYAIRLLGYSLIYNPWLCLIFEAMESVTSSLSFTAAVTYAAHLSSTTTDTSVQGLLGGVYYGVGKGAGSLIGGYLMKAFGTRPTYQIFSVATLITGCVYFLFNKFYIQKRVTDKLNDDDLFKKNKKRASLDAERRDVAEIEPTDAAKKVELDKLNGTQTDVNKVFDEDFTKKCSTDNVDGSSDSGVDNPVYSETETPTSVTSDARKLKTQANEIQ